MGVSPEYKAWWAARDRCNNPKNKWFHRYGGRGITMCHQWMNSYPAFLADMGTRSTPRHTLERSNNNGNYEPGNCRWATWTEQKLNSTSGPRRMDLTGQSFGLLIADWPEPKQPKRITHWRCHCYCGTIVSVSIDHLRTGHTRSCGCLHKIIVSAYWSTRRQSAQP